MVCTNAPISILCAISQFLPLLIASEYTEPWRKPMASGFSQAQRELLFAAPNFSEAEIIMIAPRYAR